MNGYTKALVANESHEGKEGYAVKASSGKAALVATGATDLPIGVIRFGAASGGLSHVALPGDVVPVKLGGTVVALARGQAENGGTFVTDAGTGARVLSVMFLQGGDAGDQVDALVLTPIVYAE
jgi:hypothetical protein